MHLDWNPCRKCIFYTLSMYKEYNSNFSVQPHFCVTIDWSKDKSSFSKIYCLIHNSTGSQSAPIIICFLCKHRRSTEGREE